MKVQILGMMEFTTFPAPGKQEVVIRTTYRTETGYQGTLDVPKTDFSAKEVLKRIEKELPDGTELIGQTIEVGPKLKKAEE